MTSPSGEDRAISVAHLKDGLASRGARGALLMVGTQAVKAALHVGSIVALARLLSPTEFGLVAMAAAVMNFMMTFKDLGLSSATIQRESLSHAQMSSLFWINAAAGALLMVLTMLGAPLVAWFYDEPRLLGVTVVLSVGFAAAGLTVQHEALLRRQMRFGVIAAIEISSILVGVSVGIIGAIAGAGFWALVLMRLAQQLSHLFGVWLVVRWRPHRLLLATPVWDLLAFGSGVTGFNLANYFSRNADNVLIGWRWGSYSLGVYDRAYEIFLAPLRQLNTPLSSVMVPLLSRLNDDADRYRRAYLRVVQQVSLAAAIIAAFLMATADWSVDLLLGAGWEEAGRVLLLLGFAAFIQPTANAVGWLFITQGRTGEMARWGVVGASLSLVAFVAGLPWGPTGVAAAYAVSTVLLQAPLLFFLIGAKGPVSAADHYRTLMPSLAVGASVGVSITLLRTSGVLPDGLGGFAVAAALTPTVALATLLALRSGRAALSDLERGLRMLLSQKPITLRRP